MSLYETCVVLLTTFSNALLYPDIAGLLLLFGWSLALLGSMIQEYTARHRDLARLEEVGMEAARMAGSGRSGDVAETFRRYSTHAQVGDALRDLAAAMDKGFLDLKLEKVLQDSELRMARAIEPLRIGVKAGPILGLMGTLIPMGPALLGLSNGDIKSMSDNLIIAFTTTVIGLVVGGICYAALVIRTRWYRQDLSDLEYLVEILRRGTHEKI